MMLLMMTMVMGTSILEVLVAELLLLLATVSNWICSRSAIFSFWILIESSLSLIVDSRTAILVFAEFKSIFRKSILAFSGDIEGEALFFLLLFKLGTLLGWGLNGVAEGFKAGSEEATGDDEGVADAEAPSKLGGYT